MRLLLLTSISILVHCLGVYAQYDAGTVIHPLTDNTNLNIIFKNYIISDYDGDDYVDILMVKSIAAKNTNQLTWYKGNGKGKFFRKTNILEVKSDFRENEIFYKDMNDDGINDIAFQNSDTSFTILLNDGKGNISEQIENEVTTRLEYVGADLKNLVDIDNDGDIDGIFFVKEDKRLLAQFDGIYIGYCLIGYNNGNGTFTDYTSLKSGSASGLSTLIKTGDVDGDGDIDVICSGGDELIENGRGGPFSIESPFIYIYHNLGENGFKHSLTVKLPAINNAETDLTHFKLEDINNDGAVELLVEHAFKEQCDNDLNLFNCTYSYQFDVMTYDADSKTFITSQTYNSWLHNYTLPLNFESYNELYDDAFLIQFGHQNEDDNLDILSVNAPEGKLLWYLGDGDGGFEKDQTQIVHTNEEYSNNKPTLRVADVDNDGDLDVFVLLNTETSSTLTLFKNETPVSLSNNNFVFGKMSIIPNPVSDNSYIQLSLPQNQHLSKAIYNLYTIEGVKLITGNIKDSRIFIHGLPTGVYIIDANLNGKKYIDKLIIN